MFLAVLVYQGKPWYFLKLTNPNVASAPLGFSYFGQPFSGVLYSRFPNGQFSKFSFYWQGKSHGKEYTWFENGKLQQQRSYHLGYPEGPNKLWFSDGKPRSISYYKNGELQGEAWSWHDDGRPAAYAKYDNGREVAFKSFTARDKPFHNFIRKDETIFGFKGDSKCDPLLTR